MVFVSSVDLFHGFERMFAHTVRERASPNMSCCTIVGYTDTNLSVYYINIHVGNDKLKTICKQLAPKTAHGMSEGYHQKEGKNFIK